MSIDLTTTLKRIDVLAEFIDISDRSGCVIFGSAAIALHGVDLRREIDDLDVVVSEDFFLQLKARYPEETIDSIKDDNREYYSIIDIAEGVDIRYPPAVGISYEELLRNAKVLSNTRGFSVASLADVIKWKRSMGREKDLRDVEIIEKHTTITISPKILRHVLDHLPCLLIRDFLLDIFTITEKTKAVLLPDGRALPQHDYYCYVGKLLDIDGILYTVTAADGLGLGKHEPLMVKSLETPTVPQLSARNSAISLAAGDLANITVPIETRMGLLLLNYTILVDPFGALIPYINDQWYINKIETDYIFEALRSDAITVEQVKHYSRNLHFIGHFTELAVPTLSEKSLTVSPAIIKRRDELLHEHRAEIAAGDLVVMSKIESELIAMDKDNLKGDESALFYDQSPSKSYDVTRKAMYLMTGMVQEFGGKDFNFVESSLEEGWNTEDFAVICNEIRRGSYNRAKETAKGGEETKFLIRVFQNTQVTEEDCHSQNYLAVKLTREVAAKFIYRNILVDGALLTLTIENLSSYVGKTVLMRSPLYCHTQPGYCFTCMGELFRTIDQEVLTMVSVNVTSTFTNAALKSMHSNQAKRIEVVSLNKFVV